jgi:hypothetical protein
MKNIMKVSFASIVVQHHGVSIDPEMHYSIQRVVKIIDPAVVDVDFLDDHFYIATDTDWSDVMKKNFGKQCKDVSSKLAKKVVNNRLFDFEHLPVF